MMKLFDIFKKKETVCKHKYKDFPWYIEYERCKDMYDFTYTVKIKEPYVCLLCGNRIDKTLCSQSKLTKREAERCIDQFMDIHKDRIQDAAIVEDMVNDCQLVDRAFVESYELSQQIAAGIMSGEYSKPSDDIMEMLTQNKRGDAESLQEQSLT